MQSTSRALWPNVWAASGLLGRLSNVRADVERDATDADSIAMAKECLWRGVVPTQVRRTQGRGPWEPSYHPRTAVLSHSPRTIRTVVAAISKRSPSPPRTRHVAEVLRLRMCVEDHVDG